MQGIFSYKHEVHDNMVGGSMIWFPLVIALSERDIKGVKPGPLGWHTSTLTGVPPTIALL